MNYELLSKQFNITSIIIEKAAHGLFQSGFSIVTSCLNCQ